MRTQVVCLALATVLVCPFASAQWAQTNGLNNRQVPHHPLMGATVSQETPRELLGLPTKHRMHTDSLRGQRMQFPFPNERLTSNGIQRSPRPLLKMSSPQSQIYVIDTAIVRSTQDTTRHLYSFNASAKRTAELTQKFTGGLWVDIKRETYTYDASGNMLTFLSIFWDGTQWVNVWRYTYTYDANGNISLFDSETWSGSTWVPNDASLYSTTAVRVRFSTSSPTVTNQDTRYYGIAIFR